MSTTALASLCMFATAPRPRCSNAFVKTPSSLALLKSDSNKSLGLKSSSGFRTHAMYKIKLITPEGEEHEFEAPDDAYVLDSAENAGIELPYSCRAGACSTCAGQLVSGSVDQSDGSFLDDNQMKQGYLLTCIAYPTSDCVIQTHKETDLYWMCIVSVWISVGKGYLVRFETCYCSLKMFYGLGCLGPLWCFTIFNQIECVWCDNARLFICFSFLPFFSPLEWLSDVATRGRSIRLWKKRIRSPYLEMKRAERSWYRVQLEIRKPKAFKASVLIKLFFGLCA